MTTKKPVISVLMLSYNHEKFILDSLNSVFKNNSIMWELEVVLIDDGSSDNTPELIEKYISTTGNNIKFFKLKHEGIHSISRNFNKLIKLASGDYLCFLASDDLFINGRFSNQLNMMIKNPKIVLCYSDGVTVKDGIQIGGVLPKTEKALLKKGDARLVYEFITQNVPSIFIQGSMIDARFAKNIILFDEDLIADDWVFNINIFFQIMNLNLNFAYIDEKIFIRNIHKTNTSRDPLAHFMRIEQVCKKYIRKPNLLIAQQFLFSFKFCFNRNNLNKLPALIKLTISSKINLINIMSACILIIKNKLSKN